MAPRTCADGVVATGAGADADAANDACDTVGRGRSAPRSCGGSCCSVGSLAAGVTRVDNASDRSIFGLGGYDA